MRIIGCCLVAVVLAGGRGVAAAEDVECPEYGFEVQHTRLWSHEGYREPFVLGPKRETGDGYTERVFRQGRARIRIRLQDSHRWAADDVHRLLAGAVASLPGLLVQRLPVLTLAVLDRRPANGATALFLPADEGAEFPWLYLVEMDWTVVKIGNDGSPSLDPLTEELLAHQLAHVFDHHGARLAGRDGLYSHSAEWTAAVADSPCAVSAHALANAKEDFAESVVAWLGYYAARTEFIRTSGGRFAGFAPGEVVQRTAVPASDRKALRTRLGRRFSVLSRIMHSRLPPAPESGDGAVIRSTRANTSVLGYALEQYGFATVREFAETYCRDEGYPAGARGRGECLAAFDMGLEKLGTCGPSWTGCTYETGWGTGLFLAMAPLTDLAKCVADAIKKDDEHLGRTPSQRLEYSLEVLRHIPGELLVSGLFHVDERCAELVEEAVLG